MPTNMYREKFRSGRGSGVLQQVGPETSRPCHSGGSHGKLAVEGHLCLGSLAGKRIVTKLQYNTKEQ